MNLRSLVLTTLILSHPMTALAAEAVPSNSVSGTAASTLLLPGAALSGSSAGKQCPNQGRMRTLCGYIGNKAKDTTPNSDYTFFYQRVVYEAACVDYFNDSDEEIARKVQTMWALHGQHLRCGPMGVPATGSPLRYAIHTMFDEFVRDALNSWKLDLNQIEDGMTMLDFIDDRISKSSGVLKSDLEEYRRSFVLMGAKNAKDL